MQSTAPSSSSAPSLVPPFDRAGAEAKVKKAQDLWNTMNPQKTALAYTEDSIWRNRDQFFQGRAAIERFLTDKWANETQYKLKKRLFSFDGNRIAVQFWYEYYSHEEQQWKRTYGLEHWTFAPDGLMAKRHMSGNEVTILENDRWFRDGVNPDDVEVYDRDG
ncbi:hypothetical protein Rhopal_003426-T1 [Rhodotorula paludigena]|uniref:Uncharacterized protein n=1 Tax=Rhodotorula paludigena TaxID=86838 RepID=A0AAV5GKP3_9BASI|nr:hypothetical protein Rhopal_003426-T1 [Rhodotorula paludigena]